MENKFVKMSLNDLQKTKSEILKKRDIAMSLGKPHLVQLMDLEISNIDFVVNDKLYMQNLVRDDNPVVLETDPDLKKNQENVNKELEKKSNSPIEPKQQIFKLTKKPTS